MLKKCLKCGQPLIPIDGKNRCLHFPIRCDFQEEIGVIDYLKSNYIVFDFETTGFSNREDRITEIAAVKVVEGKILDSYHAYLKPDNGKKVNANITAITGITNEMLEGKSEEAEGIADFVQWLKSDEEIRYDFAVAHNGEFDFGMLKAACQRQKIPMPLTVLVDTLKIAKDLFPKGNKEGLPNNKQETLAKFFNISYDAHRADEDVKALQQVFIALINRLEKYKDYRKYY